jgi:hypothetical protein
MCADVADCCITVLFGIFVVLQLQAKVQMYHPAFCLAFGAVDIVVTTLVVSGLRWQV